MTFEQTEKIGIAAVAVILAMCVAAIVLAVVYDDKPEFMEECVRDGRKRYECEALYGQAHPPVHFGRF